jgi:hypothetical protein
MFQPGSITPAADGELMIVGATWNTSGRTITGADSGYAVVSQHEQGANGVSGGILTNIQTTATAANPHITFSGNENAGGLTHAAFKP